MEKIVDHFIHFFLLKGDVSIWQVIAYTVFTIVWWHQLVGGIDTEVKIREKALDEREKWLYSRADRPANSHYLWKTRLRLNIGVGKKKAK